MAELTDDRGQLVLVGALVVAVAMVVMSVLLNGAIFTQTVATRDIAAGDHDALQYRNVSEDAVTEIVVDENDEEYGTQTKVYENVTHGIERYSNLSRRTSLAEGTYVTVNQSTLSVHNGSLLRQNDSTRAFESAGDDGNWTLATGVPGVRQFSLVVESVETASSPTNDDSDAFYFRLIGSGGNEWLVYFYDGTGGGDVTIEVQNGTGASVDPACSGVYSSTPVTVNLTAATVNDQSCPALSFGTGTSAPYDLNFSNGTHATGTYNVTVDTEAGGSVNSGNFNDPGNADPPYDLPVIYSVEADVIYETPRLRYNDTVRVAPGEPA